MICGRRHRPLVLGGLVAVAAVAVVLVGGSGPASVVDPGPPPATAAVPPPTVPSVPPTGPAPSTSAPAPLALADEVVAAHIGHLIGSTAVGSAGFGVAVRGPRGQVIVDHRADELLMPASTAKSLTAALALMTFGPEHQFTTTAKVAGALTGQGILIGDLLLVGGGDPALGTEAFDEWYPARPRTRLEDLADAVAAAGVRRISGTVVGVDPLLSGPMTAAGWKQQYLDQWDARRITGLTVDMGLVLTRTDNGNVIAAMAADPRRTAARAFAALLEERGIVVVGEPRAVPSAEGYLSRPPEIPARVLAVEQRSRSPVSAPRSRVPDGFALAAVESPPLAQLLRFEVQQSDNHFADTLARVAAREITGNGGWSALDVAVGLLLRDLGIDDPGIHLADGSGLSRDSRLSAGVLAELQVRMATSAHRVAWSRLQAVAAERGTLRTWLAGTPAVGRFLGKTGTLDDTKAVTGTVYGPDADEYHLAIIVNAAGDPRWNVRALMDQLVLTLAAVLDGCVDLEEVRGLGAYAAGSCPRRLPVDELLPVEAAVDEPELPSDEPVGAADSIP